MFTLIDDDTKPASLRYGYDPYNSADRIAIKARIQQRRWALKRESDANRALADSLTFRQFNEFNEE